MSRPVQDKRDSLPSGKNSGFSSSRVEPTTCTLASPETGATAGFEGWQTTKNDGLPHGKSLGWLTAIPETSLATID